MSDLKKVFNLEMTEEQATLIGMLTLYGSASILTDISSMISVGQLLVKELDKQGKAKHIEAIQLVQMLNKSLYKDPELKS